MKNGVTKIKKALQAAGYDVHYVTYEMYRHSCSWHKGEVYYVDVYRTSNGYYIKCKTGGKSMYYLCDSLDGLSGCICLAFSQQQFFGRNCGIFSRKGWHIGRSRALYFF